LTYPDEFAHSYQHLKYAGMPPSCLKAETFCPDILRGHPGISPFAEGLMPLDHAVPVLAVQAFHIYGGLVLSLYVHHNVADCSGINEFWKHYAESVRHRRGFDSPCNVSRPLLILHRLTGTCSWCQSPESINPKVPSRCPHSSFGISNGRCLRTRSI
jgi:hypothetical protein